MSLIEFLDVLIPGVLVPGIVGRCAADTGLYWLRVAGWAF